MRDISSRGCSLDAFRNYTGSRTATCSIHMHYNSVAPKSQIDVLTTACRNDIIRITFGTLILADALVNG